MTTSAFDLRMSPTWLAIDGSLFLNDASPATVTPAGSASL
jgi:hypothetical protein